MSLPLSVPRQVVDAPARRRFGALVLLLSRTVRDGSLSRVGRFYAWAIMVGHAALLVFWARAGAEGVAADVLPKAVGWMSWAAGLVACSAARDLERDDSENGIAALAESRGASPAEQRTARWLATFRVVSLAVGLPGVALATVSLVAGVRPLASSVSAILGVAAYAILFGAVFGALSRWAGAVSARHGRLLFAAVVLVPFALRHLGIESPDLVRAFSFMLDHVAVGGQ